MKQIREHFLKKVVAPTTPGSRSNKAIAKSVSDAFGLSQHLTSVDTSNVTRKCLKNFLESFKVKSCSNLYISKLHVEVEQNEFFYFCSFPQFYSPSLQYIYCMMNANTLKCLPQTLGRSVGYTNILWSQIESTFQCMQNLLKARTNTNMLIPSF